MEKKRIVLVLLCFFVIANIFSTLVFIRNYTSYMKYIEMTILTGKSLSGMIRLLVEGGGVGTITIISPENITYNFSIGDTYLIDLNVSSDFEEDTWWYTLTDLKHNQIIYSEVIFPQNATLTAVRWDNQLDVYANDSTGGESSSSVVFYVSIPNSMPIINEFDQNQYICEGDYFSDFFNATDVDEDLLSSDISPKDPFYVFPTVALAANTTRFEIFSGTLNKNHAGGTDAGSQLFEETIYVQDNYNDTCCVDSALMNITVIEINNVPSITNPGVQTIWNKGVNGTFYHELSVIDIEDGAQDNGILKFNISVTNHTDEIYLFNISSSGVINFTASTDQIGVYEVNISVTDTGIDNPHPNILGNCSQDGGNITSVETFSLTITGENRQPTITDYSPENLTLNISGVYSTEFNVTKYDSDGTVPDTYWYVDENLIQLDSGNATDFFSYTFPCETFAGEHYIKAEITDGLLNDSVKWNATIEYLLCPTGEKGASGGTSSSISDICPEKWVCGDWGVCQNLEESLKEGLLTGEDYRIVEENCTERKLDKRTCGFHPRNCFDINSCNTTKRMLLTVEECYYIKEPDCYDGIRNCHDNGCEVLVDCGGPCEACPTCSDGIRNQGEEKIDCGGPCLVCYEKEKELYEKSFLTWIIDYLANLPIIRFILKKENSTYGLMALAALLMILIVIKTIKIFKTQGKIDKLEKE